MKSAKLFSTLLLFVSVFFLTQPAHAANAGKGKIEIIITSNTTQHQLDSIKTAVALKGIDMDIDGTVRSKAGQLKNISGKITCSPKSSATFSSDRVGTITIAIKGSSIKVDVKDLPAE